MMHWPRELFVRFPRLQKRMPPHRTATIQRPLAILLVEHPRFWIQTRVVPRSLVSRMLVHLQLAGIRLRQRL